MGIIGVFGLLIAFAGLLVSIVLLVVGHLQRSSRKGDAGEVLLWAAHVATVVATLALTFCCALLVFCFLGGDNTIDYVVRGRSHATGPLGTLFRIAGLWEGREGSVLFWAWLIALFGTVMALRNMKKLEALDNMALVVLQAVLISFVSILLFSEDNSPFTAIDAQYLRALRLCRGHARGRRRQRQLGGALAALRHGVVVVLRHRHRLGRHLGLRGARLGRLLGLGPG